jgi:hypothetical protein
MVAPATSTPSYMVHMEKIRLITPSSMSCLIRLALGAGSAANLHAAALAVLDDPGMPLNVLEGNALLRVKNQ